jgi:hypothetical protein
MPDTDDFHQSIGRLVAQILTYPPDSAQRRRLLNQLVRRVMQSGKLWKEYKPYYGDALQQMWEYCLTHLEEYDPSRASVTTWLNYYLKKRLRYFRDRSYRELNRRATPYTTSEDKDLDPLDRVSAPEDIEPVIDIWQHTLKWVETDPDGILRATCFRKRPDINAQTLFLKRFPSETPWKDIAADFDLDEAETKDLPKFYNRKCLPLLRNFGSSQGYINS